MNAGSHTAMRVLLSLSLLHAAAIVTEQEFSAEAQTPSPFPTEWKEALPPTPRSTPLASLPPLPTLPKPTLTPLTIPSTDDLKAKYLSYTCSCHCAAEFGARITVEQPGMPNVDYGAVFDLISARETNGFRDFIESFEFSWEGAFLRDGKRLKDDFPSCPPSVPIPDEMKNRGFMLDVSEPEMTDGCHFKFSDLGQPFFEKLWKRIRNEKYKDPVTRRDPDWDPAEYAKKTDWVLHASPWQCVRTLREIDWFDQWIDSPDFDPARLPEPVDQSTTKEKE